MLELKCHNPETNFRETRSHLSTSATNDVAMRMKCRKTRMHDANFMFVKCRNYQTSLEGALVETRVLALRKSINQCW